MLPDESFVDNGAQILVDQGNDFIDFVGGPKAVEEMQEGNAGFERGSLGN